MGTGFQSEEDFIQFQNRWIMDRPTQEEFDKYCDKIIVDIDTSNYIGD